MKLPKIYSKYMPVFTKKYIYEKTNINDYDTNELKYKKYTLIFLYETGIRANELKNILYFNNKTITIKGKGNKTREIFHKIKTTKRIGVFPYTTKTLRK
jgi:integrase/recombinase XerD